MRRELNQQDIDREAVECLEVVIKEREMRRNAADGDWERTLNYVKRGQSRSKWKLVMSIGALVVAAVAIVSFFAREAR